MRIIPFLEASVIMMMAFLAPVASGAEFPFPKGDGNTILIRQDTTGEPDAPRMPIPFFAELMDGIDAVLLGAVAPCGIVSVQITSTAGDDYSTIFNTATGAIVLPISGNSGYYTLRIDTAGGLHFIGEFTI